MRDPQHLCCSAQEMSDFGVSPPYTLLGSSWPIPDVERVRSVGFVHPVQLSLEVTLSGDNPEPGIGEAYMLLGINICDFTEVM